MQVLHTTNSSKADEMTLKSKKTRKNAADTIFHRYIINHVRYRTPFNVK